MKNLNPIYLEEGLAKEVGKTYLILASILGAGGVSKHFSPRCQERRMIQQGISELGGKIKGSTNSIIDSIKGVSNKATSPLAFNLSKLSPEAKYSVINSITYQWPNLISEMENNPELKNTILKKILSNDEIYQILKKIAYNSTSRSRRVRAYRMLCDIENMRNVIQ